MDAFNSPDAKGILDENTGYADIRRLAFLFVGERATTAVAKGFGVVSSK